MFFVLEKAQSTVSTSQFSPTSTRVVTTTPTTPTSVRDSTNPATVSTTHINPTSAHDVTSTTPVTLNKPGLDLDVTAVNNQINYPRLVAALPEGEAAVVNAGRLIKQDTPSKNYITVSTVTTYMDCFYWDLIYM